MNHKDRLALYQLSLASNDQQSASRKRQRDEDIPHEATRRAHRASGPWGGMGQTGLTSDRRQSNAEPPSTRSPSNLAIQSRAKRSVHWGPLAYAPSSHASLEGTAPGLVDPKAAFQSSHQSSPAQPPPFSGLSPDSDDATSGLRSLAQILGDAETPIDPEPPELHDSERAISRDRSAMKPEGGIALNRLNTTSNGRDSGNRKRQRDEDNPRETTRRTHRASGPWGGVGQDGLQSDRRQSNGNPTSTSFNNLPFQSRGKKSIHGGSLAHALPARPSLEGTLPDLVDPKSASTGGQPSHQSSPAQPPPFSGLSPETDDVMSESPSLAQVLGSAEIPISPEPPKLHVSERTISRSRSRSSPDPIDYISPTAKPSGHTTAKPSSHATAAPIPVEDDNSDDLVEEVTPARSRPPPPTPEKQTPLQPGHVRETRPKFDPPKSQGQSILKGYLGQTRPSQPGSSSRTAAAKTGPIKGQQLIPGVIDRPARPPPARLTFYLQPQISQTFQQAKISRRMNARVKDSASSAGQSGLVVATVASRSQNPPSKASAPPTEHDSQQQPIALRLLVQDWYCGSRHHTTGRKGKDSYMLTFNGTNLTLSRRGGAFHILQGDLRGFEVVYSDAGEEFEFIPVVLFLFEDKFVSSAQWKDYSGGDSDPTILVYFDAEPIDFATGWQELISRMSRWTQKHIITINTMKNMIKYMADRASSAKTAKQQAGPTLVAPTVQVQSSHQSSPAQPPPSSESSPETDNAMSGSLMLAEVLGNAEIPVSPQPPKLHVSERVISRGRSRSSSDPINVIPTAKPSSHTTAAPFSVEDEDSVGIAEETTPAPSRPPLNIPNKRTPLRAGHVRETHAKLNPPKPQSWSTLRGFFGPTRPSESGSSSRTDAAKAWSTKGQPIIPGLTRQSARPPPAQSVFDVRAHLPLAAQHARASNRMGMKIKDPVNSARQPEVVIATVEDRPQKPCNPKPSTFHNPDEMVLLYPQSGTGAVTIKRGDLAHLAPGILLNESLIELGLKMWLNDLQERDPTLVDQIHVFDPFFFTKLYGERGKGCAYDQVKKWTAKFDLFSKKFIIIPIYEQLHWYLAIICFPEHSLKSPHPHLSAHPTRAACDSDSEEKGTSQPIGDGKSQKTWILILDSLGWKHPRTVQLLREYLQSEAQERHKIVVELRDARSSGGFVEDKHLLAPVQPNWYDSGEYLLHYAEVFHLNPLKILALPNGARRRTHPEFPQYEELWQTSQATQKRETFRDKVHALSSAWLESKRLTSKSDTPVAEPPNLQVTHGLPPVPNIEGDGSLRMIEPSTVTPEEIPNTTSSLNSRPPRIGILPSWPAELSEGEWEDEVEIVMIETDADEANASRATRRNKRGTRHSSRHSLERSQGSPDL